MAGHSKFKNIVHRKTAQDSKKSTVFAKLAREIIFAVKSSSYQEIYLDSRVQDVIKNAKNNNMPKENIERAINKALMSKNRPRQDLTIYECKGPSGVLMIIEADTDNRTKTSSEMRSILNKYNFAVINTNSITHLFVQIGIIEYVGVNTDMISEKILALLDNNQELLIEEITSNLDSVIIQTKKNHFHKAVEILTMAIGCPSCSEISWKSLEMVTLAHDYLKKFQLMIDAIYQIEGIEFIYHNVGNQE